MSWFTPILMTHDLTDDLGAPHYARRGALGAPFAGGAAPAFTPAVVPPGVARSKSLGSAQAASQWSWAASVTPSPLPATPGASATPALAHEGACLRAPVELLARMAQMASATGRSESEVWIEAAREWLLRRRGASDPAPAAPALAAAPTPPAALATVRRGVRRWGEIDALLMELRAPTRALPTHEGAPAA